MARLPNRLQSEFEQARQGGGGIQPVKRALPSDEPMKRLTDISSKVGRGVLSGLQRLNSSGSRTSPTTKRDR